MESGYFRVGRFGGAPIRIHWTAPLGAFAFCGFQFVPAGWAAFVFLILIHELGHAFFVKRFHLELMSVDVHGIGGQCRYYGGTTPIRSALIAWGGIFAQAIILAIAFTTRMLLPPITNIWLLQVFDTLIRTNLFVMAINLMPIPGFDGAEAWKLFGANGLRAWWRRRSILKSQPKGVLRNMPPPKRRFISNVADDILENTPTDQKRPPPHMLN